mmetsp:Transcript_4687/g.14139  ORF Transcript_4687/g.14139 Transcript_4687/m.14139 type:complete len:298 (-) Transcript_4687:1754-2647(-)
MAFRSTADAMPGCACRRSDATAAAAATVSASDRQASASRSLTRPLRCLCGTTRSSHSAVGILPQSPRAMSTAFSTMARFRGIMPLRRHRRRSRMQSASTVGVGSATSSHSSGASARTITSLLHARAIRVYTVRWAAIMFVLSITVLTPAISASSASNWQAWWHSSRRLGSNGRPPACIWESAEHTRKPSPTRASQASDLPTACGPTSRTRTGGCSRERRLMVATSSSVIAATDALSSASLGATLPSSSPPNCTTFAEARSVAIKFSSSVTAITPRSAGGAMLASFLRCQSFMSASAS